LNDYKKEINELLEKNMTEKGFKLWLGINTLVTDIWNRPSSSTGKYHKKEGGRVPDIAEHTFEMLYNGLKILRMFDIKPNTSRCDAILFAIGLHDILKYGEHGELKHTTGQHDRLAGDLISGNFETFRKVMDDKDIVDMAEAARFHSGRWSTDIKDRNAFKWNNFNPETLFVHMLDMLSTGNCLKLPTEE
jgi:hypothetical protein